MVVHGIPWSYESDQLSALFTDFDPSFGIESAEVVYGKDNRSRVRRRRAIPCTSCALCTSRGAVRLRFASRRVLPTCSAAQQDRACHAACLRR